jgi:hypothetical protein
MRITSTGWERVMIFNRQLQSVTLLSDNVVNALYDIAHREIHFVSFTQAFA